MGSPTISATLRQRARRAGIEPLGLSPSRGDFNEDLRLDSGDALAVRVREQLSSGDVIALMEASA